MPYITSSHDGARLSYRDYIPASSPTPFKPHGTDSQAPAPPNPVLVFSSAWPFSSKMWDAMLVPLVETYRFRCIAPDRRGYGRSEWNGSDTTKAEKIDYDTFAADMVQILEGALPSSSSGSFIGVGASLGCGELLMSLSRSALLRSRCRGLVFIGSSLPIPLATAEKPNGPPREFWNTVLQGLRDDKMGWMSGTGLPFIFGSDGLSASEMARYERICDESDPIALERTVQAFLDRDLTGLMSSVAAETALEVLILQGDRDKVNPIEEGPAIVKRCLPKTEIVVYEGGYHGELEVIAVPWVRANETSFLSLGLAHTHRAQCIDDILKFSRKLSTALRSEGDSEKGNRLVG